MVVPTEPVRDLVLPASIGPRASTRPRPMAYITVVIAVALTAFLYKQRKDGIFACQARGYGNDAYLSYCQASQYGDYDHGAFWFDLEPVVVDRASHADVLVLGNSRMQLAMSTPPVARWFSTTGASYYLLGFSHHGNYKFAVPLLAKLKPRARVYIVNLDLFFEPKETEPAGAVLHDPALRRRYAEKRAWQPAHRFICRAVPVLCRDEYTFFRSRGTGAWMVQGGTRLTTPVSLARGIDSATVATYVPAARRFVQSLPVDRECVVLAMVPTVKTPLATMQAVADSLDMPLIAPMPEGLTTFDGSHLDGSSASSWSAAFLAAADGAIRQCLASGAGHAPSAE